MPPRMQRNYGPVGCLCRALLLLVGLVGSAAAEQGPAEAVPARLQPLLERLVAQKRQAITRAELSLRAEKGARLKRPFTREQSQARLKRLKQLEAELRAAQDQYQPVFDKLPSELKVGDIGLAPGKATVRRIVDAEQLLVRLEFITAVAGAFSGATKTFVHRKQADVLLRGLSTAGLADGSAIELPKPLEVVGTEKFGVPGKGEATLFVLKPVELTPVLAALNPSQAKPRGD